MDLSIYTGISNPIDKKDTSKYKDLKTFDWDKPSTQLFFHDKNGKNGEYTQYIIDKGTRLNIFCLDAKNEAKRVIWEDTDNNGKYDLKVILGSDGYNVVIDGEEELDESKYDIKQFQDTILKECQKEDDEYALSKLHVNGKIENFQMGKAADCWLLSGIKALSDTSYGAKIIKNSISQASNGNVTVTLKGVNETYTFTPKEIDEEKEYLSSGDDDVDVFEMAVKKHRKKNLLMNYPRPYYLNKNLGKRIPLDALCPLDAGNTDEAFFLFTGKELRYFSSDKPHDKESLKIEKEIEEIYPEFFQYTYSGDVNKVLSAKQYHFDDYIAGVCFKSNKDEMKMGHGYSIKKVDADFVTIIDPWDSSKEIKVSKKDFIDNWSEIVMCNIKDGKALENWLNIPGARFLRKTSRPVY